MSRVTIVTRKGTERVPAKQAVQRIESGEATLDEKDERGVAALAAYLKVRITPLRSPKPNERVEGPAVVSGEKAEKKPGKKAPAKAAGGKKKTTKKPKG